MVRQAFRIGKEGIGMLSLVRDNLGEIRRIQPFRWYNST